MSRTEHSLLVHKAIALVGMLSVHHRQTGTPDECVLALFAHIARRAGALLEAALA